MVNVTLLVIAISFALFMMWFLWACNKEASRLNSKNKK